ncbi:hypothetical protein JKP88DRAFT_240937 [Tribonema minus]|uniref:Uncharacterized protein n=1 Tax=Tribonema minus TaxID=303371 RepID=A0A835ZA38_9STRA|nr:hypothetical protein JKP88DRAFT_240937 [Tribonema minus]
MASEHTKESLVEMIPFLKSFYGADETTAGKMVESVFVLFGIFSVLHGLDKLHLLHGKMSHLLESKYTNYAIYAAIGTFLTAFYSLVVYTDADIDKDEKQMAHYKLIGIAGGLSFLICFPFYVLMYHQKGAPHNAATYASMGAIVAITAWIGVIVKEAYSKQLRNFKGALLNLLMVFANSF